MQLAEQQVDFGANRVVERELNHQFELVEQLVEFGLERGEPGVDELEALLDAREHLGAGRAAVRSHEPPEQIDERGDRIPDIDNHVDVRLQVDVDVHILYLNGEAIK